MIAVLTNRTYAALFAAQVVALLGTGLLTVALGLLAFDLAGGDAGLVLGAAMSVKMIAYVGVAPLVSAFVAGLPPKVVLVGADVVRAGVAIALPFVGEVWQIFVLIFLLQAASATFTPMFQAVIPVVLPDERDYTRALSLSRLAYDLESLLSPALAAAALAFVHYDRLFTGTAIGFLVSTAIVLAIRVPDVGSATADRFAERLLRGVREFVTRPELRALLGFDLAVAAGMSMVAVNTVVIVQGDLGRSPQDVALLLGVFGAGSMLVAFGTPRLVDRWGERPMMLAGGLAVPFLLACWAVVAAVPTADVRWPGVCLLWGGLGAATAAVSTPSSRVLRRNVDDRTRAVVFAARFSLSHACFLIAYPVAGSLGALGGTAVASLALALLAVCGVGWAARSLRASTAPSGPVADAD